ncbi:transposable element Tc3 transposase [Trichonephila clavipes]|nr:transposable element Tc3 transposase [Trichonephila clavipes]
MIQCVTEKPDEYIVSDTEEFLFENCLNDVKEDKACIPLKKADPVVVVPEMSSGGPADSRMAVWCLRYFQAPPIILLLMLMNTLSVLGACQWLDARRGGSRRKGERGTTPLKEDEAYFWLNGYVNKQNCRIWSEANPQVYVETPLHPEKLTVWCALLAGGIIGPYVFKIDEGHNVTVNGDRYRTMFTNFFIPQLNNHDVQELWFQQDGATCHTARATIDLLKDTFGNHLISRFGPVNWPPRSCDLTPLDYFLWGYVKSLVYADKPHTLDHLEDNIRRVIADIRPQMLENVIENWTSRLDYVRASRSCHMPEIILNM